MAYKVLHPNYSDEVARYNWKVLSSTFSNTTRSGKHYGSRINVARRCDS